ncbi:YeeE/YedE family protein [Profundibacterium mesophilum]|uniref:Sulfur transport domain containing protein n=1 Tax=Profundibacterium mesophilum KAUST100406-0324 TaxID=1037889 RepID=A0A921NXE1_9RHOB|nr:YeeE/YedE family protein [Profundibacterium mesophilum]KAF0675278.1 sulfur transport domain containing protein [Profundibacterium mesophilum KAUST100406-0324]
MLDWLGEPTVAALIGMGSGMVLGAAARLGRFCTLGALEDALYGGSLARLRMWGIAIGVAVMAVFALIAAGLFDPMDSFYLAQGWSLPGAVLGGLVFGYGMALAGNCGYGALARLGGGDMRAFVIVLVMGLAAYVTLSGPLAAARVALFVPGGGPVPGIGHWLAQVTGLPLGASGMLAGFAIFVLSLRGASRPGRGGVICAICVGLAVAMGWAGTAWLFRTGFDALPVASHSFSAPLGETMLYAMTSSGAALSFGVGSVAGVLLGAFAGSLWKGQFRWEACEDPRELKRQILGAGLMGWGAVTAAGCSIGQGITAFSVLAVSAPLTLAAIALGAAIGLRQLLEGFALAD